jgi:hypothetical protein
MHPLLRISAAVALAAALSSCLPVTSSSPLGTTVAATADPKLTGMWKGKVGSAANAYMTFYPERDGTMKIVLLAPPAADDEGGWMIFAARATVLGSNTYLDARAVEDGGKPPDPKLAHVPVLYRVNGDGSLVLYLIDEAAARGAIGKGKIAGTIEPGDQGDVMLTADPAALDAFFASDAGRALFTSPLAVLQRVK